MMKNILFILVFVLSAGIQAQTDYSQLWKQYDKAMKKDLPQDALKEAKAIFKIAEKEKVFPQMLYALMRISETKAGVNPDDFSTEAIEKLLKNEKDAANKSVLHVSLASLISMQMESHQNDYDEETTDSMKAAVVEHLSHALDSMDVLAQTIDTTFVPIVQGGRDSEMFCHDLLHVVLSFVQKFDGSVSWRLRTPGYVSGLRGIAEAGLSKAITVYEALGRSDAVILTRLAHILMFEDADKRRESLLDLLLESRGSKAGADVAYEFNRYAEKPDYVRFLSAVIPEKYEECKAWMNAENDDEALLFLKWAEKEYASSPFVNDFKNEIIEKENISVSVETKTVILPDRPFPLTIRYANAHSVRIVVRRFNGYDGEEYSRIPRLDGAVVETRNVQLATDSLNRHRESLGLTVCGESHVDLKLPVGHYVVDVETDGAKREEYEYPIELNVTSAFLTVVSLPKQSAVVVTDAVTGKPLEGITVECRQGGEKGKIKTYKTGRDGKLLIQKTDVKELRLQNIDSRTDLRAVRSPNDMTSWVSASNYWWQDRTEQAAVDIHLSLFTDRGIYRPGQKLHVNVVAYSQLKDELEVVKEETVTVKLRDPHSNAVAEAKLNLNEFGSADTVFVLPAECALGEWRLDAEFEKFSWLRSSSSQMLRVEEYKRPTFDVKLQLADSSQTFTFGDTVYVKGVAKSFAGVPLQNANVSYKANCRVLWFFGWMFRRTDYYNSSNQTGSGTVLTDANGEFLIPVFLTDKFVNRDSHGMVFELDVTVTSGTGETHDARFQTKVTRQQFALGIDCNDVLDLNKDKLLVKAFNASSAEVKTDGEWFLMREKIGKGRTDEPSDTLASGHFSTGNAIQLIGEKHLSKRHGLAAGTYRFVACSVDSKGNKIEAQKQIHVFDSGRLKGKTDFADFFVYTQSTEVDETTPAELFYAPHGGVSAYCYGYVVANDAVVDSFVVKTDAGINRLVVPYRKEYNDGFSVCLFYVFEGRQYEAVSVFTQKKPNKSLTLKWKTFRDRLTAGQKEQWVMSVCDANGNPLNESVELLAAMYDASLDKISGFNWNLNIDFYCYVFLPNVSNSYDFGNRYLSLSGDIHYLDKVMRKFSFISSASSARYLFAKEELRGGFQRMPKLMAAPRALAKGVVNDHKMVVGLSRANSDESVLEEESAPADEESSIRSNFEETAFFMPHVVTDEVGEAVISFTLPESLTRWKVLAFAHTKDMVYGMKVDEVVASKDFMLRPNMPRFVRVGDKAVIASQVVNMTNDNVSGTVRMRVLKAQSGEVIMTDSCLFACSAHGEQTVAFSLEVASADDDVTVEIVASAANGCSDGERNLLPVLDNHVLLSESVPFFVQNEDSVTVDISQAFNGGSQTAVDRRLSVEYVSNPALLALEPLHSVEVADNESAVSASVAWYANIALACVLPRVSDYVATEKASKLFDLAEKAKQQLDRLQNDDGGWSWFKGMGSNLYTTMAVVQTLVEMRNMAERYGKVTLVRGYDEKIKRALAFLDKRMIEEYKRSVAKKHMLTVSNHTADYLAVVVAAQSLRPLAELQKDAAWKQMFDAYVELLDKAPRNLTIYGKATASLVLRRCGKTKRADELVKSILQYSVFKPGFGRYYATDAAYYSWMDYRIPTQLAAMKAIDEQQGNAVSPELMEMQLWLLRQKQTQQWKNPISTIRVVDWLLRQNVSFVSAVQAPKVRLCSDGESADVNNARSVVVVPPPVAVDSLSSASAAPAKPAIGWGVVNTSCRENINSVKQYSSGEMSVEAVCYVQAADGSWKKLNASAPLSKGNKVRVRYTIGADRDMDFVRLDCQHPAAFEPVKVQSGYQMVGTRAAHLSIHDEHTEVFFETFRKGRVTVDMEYFVSRSGSYTPGLASVQSLYAPEFGAHSASFPVVNVE